VLCDYPGCTVELPPRKGRGRRTERCPEHAKARKRERDKAKYERDKAARINSEKPQTISEGILYPCCIEWRKAGRANRTICPQHKTWHAFGGYRIRHGQSSAHDLETITSLIETGHGFRVSTDPDSWKPIDRHDKQQDKDLAEWIDAGMPGAAEMKEIYANEAAARLSKSGQLTGGNHMASSPVERQALSRVDRYAIDDGCKLYRNGVGPYADHAATCAECSLRLYLIARSRERNEYRLRDREGRVLTASWLL
jgi:hypothetical protein